MFSLTLALLLGLYILKLFVSFACILPRLTVLRIYDPTSRVSTREISSYKGRRLVPTLIIRHAPDQRVTN